MTSDLHGTTRLCLTIFLFFGSYVSSFLIIPDEFPSFLHLIYGIIPPIRKGTDSRLGVGFRLGEHADFQILLELGPQKRTNPIENDIDLKSKRTVEANNQRKSKSQIMLDSMKSKNKLDVKKSEDILKTDSLNARNSNKQAEQKLHLNTNFNSLGSEWLSRWRHELTRKSEEMILPLEMPVNVIPKDADQIRVIEDTNDSNVKKSRNLQALEALVKDSTVI